MKERREGLAELEKAVAVMAEQMKGFRDDIQTLIQGVGKINGGFRDHESRLVAIETNCRNTIAADAGRFKVLFTFRDRLWVYLGIVGAVTGGLGFLAGRFVK